MSLYAPLGDFLDRADGGSVRMTFEEVEQIIHRTLPNSAYRHREWWSNNPTGHSHARSWVEAGWRTETVDLENRVLVFSKKKSGAASPTPKRVPDPFGAMRGSVVIAPGVDLTEPTGEEWEAEREFDD